MCFWPGYGLAIQKLLQVYTRTEQISKYIIDRPGILLLEKGVKNRGKLKWSLCCCPGTQGISIHLAWCLRRIPRERHRHADLRTCVCWYTHSLALSTARAQEQRGPSSNECTQHQSWFLNTSPIKRIRAASRSGWTQGQRREKQKSLKQTSPGTTEEGSTKQNKNTKETKQKTCELHRRTQESTLKGAANGPTKNNLSNKMNSDALDYNP